MLLVDFINVGYGDAILLRETETPFAMLVDCGDARIGRSRPDGRRITAADYLRREGIRELDLLVLTHLHLDHAGGLTHLLPGVRVREFWTNYLPPEEMWGQIGEQMKPVVDGMLDSMGEDYMDVLADGAWEKIFKVKPAVFTAEEKRAWLDKNTDVALGSDAFFPFGDNIERAHKSGVKYVAEPGGSVRDDNVIETCNKYGMVMSFTGIRLFHH